MNKVFQSILVASDRYRGGTYTHRSAIELAKKFQASLRMIYIVDFKDLRIPVPGHHSGEITRRLIRGTLREVDLVDRGLEELKEFAAFCDRESIRQSSDVFVGRSEVLWAEEARSCDLVMISPVKEDFGHLEQWFGIMFWRITMRSCRPVLIFRRDGFLGNSMVLFYSNGIGSAYTLPWVTELCSVLGMSLTVHTSKGSSRDYARDDECQVFLNHHHISARFEQGKALEVLNCEVNEPGSQFDSPSLLVFDNGFHKGLRFRKHRCLVEELIRVSHHSILLCP